MRSLGLRKTLEVDHWTAWNPPDTVAECTQVYVIQTGDTLWSIAARFLGDLNLWPQIWEQNQYVLDAHWLYPGDRLIMSGAAVADFVDPQDVVSPPLEDSADFRDADTGLFPPAEEVPPTLLDSSESGIAGPPATAPVPLGYEADI